MDEMYRTFNMGIGLMAIVDESVADDVIHHFGQCNACVIGEIVTTNSDKEEQVELIN